MQDLIEDYSEELSARADIILDDHSILEEDKIELLDEMVIEILQPVFGDHKLTTEEREKIVLDLMWKHCEKEGSVRRIKPATAKIIGIDKSKSIDWVRVPEVLPEIDWSKAVDDYQKRGKEIPVKNTLPSYPDNNSNNLENSLPEDPSISPFDLLRGVVGGDYSDEYIQKTLEKHNYDINAVVCVLQIKESSLVLTSSKNDDLKVTKSETKINPAPLLPGGEEKVLCKYFVQFGECLRADCRYSHDLASRVCRFWVKGSCLNGNHCAFLHSFPEPEIEKSSSFETFCKPILNSLDDFPTLGETSKKKNRIIWSNKPQDSSEKINENKNSPELIKKSSKFNGTISFNPSAASFKPSNNVSNANTFITNTISLGTNSLTNVPSTTIKNTQTNLRLVKPQYTPWVENPKQNLYSVQKYIQYRKESFKHIELRNKYLNLAADNWRTNSPDAAKMFSVKGQTHQKQMIESCRKASEILYNAKDELGEIFYDLHGLELDTSIINLEQVLLDVEQQYNENRQIVYAISGAGYHVISKTDMLTKEVKRWLDEWAYEYKVFSIGHERFGTIIAIDPWSHI